MRLRWLTRTVSLVGILAVAATACGGGKPSSSASSAAASATSKRGGSIVVGAEQWPECVNPITSCSSATWYWYSVAEHVMPYAMVLDLNGNFVASPLLTQAPTLDNGGIKQNPFTITLKLNPNATWADGTPITSSGTTSTW